MERWFLGLGALSAFVAVGTGAFGAHALKARLEPELLAIWKTAVEYQMYHALGLILIGLVAIHRPSGWLGASGWSLVAGTVLFSGSLYVLALTGVRWLGAITPLGGLAFLIGWLLLAIAAFRR